MTRVFLMRLAGAALLAMMAAVLISQHPASAASLKSSAVVTSDLVTLGDLFEGAGDLAATPVFRAPDAGVEGALPAATALKAAKAAGLATDPSSLDSVRVIRAGTEIGEAALVELVREAAAVRLKAAPEVLQIDFDGLVPNVVADATAATPVTLAALSLQSGSGRFSARFAIDVGADIRTYDISGRTIETEEVAVLRRPVERRQVIQEADIGMERVDRKRLGRATGLDVAAVVGMAATRALRAGTMVAESDIEAPRLVKRGELVTLSYERPGISLTARGRALADGALGETVTVLNEQSRRTVQGVVIAAGYVRVDTANAAPPATASLTQ